VETEISGRSTLGVSCIGILKSEIRPNRTRSIIPTVTVTGFFMAVSTSFIVCSRFRVQEIIVNKQRLIINN